MVEETFSNKIKELRLERGLSQNDLALKVGLTQRKISKLETMQLSPSPQIIVMLARYFQVTADYLLGLEDNS